jgi:uncharacterized ferritin-like protein (DUF455 family)
MFAQIRAAILEQHPATKVHLVQQLHALLQNEQVTMIATEEIDPLPIPGRPDKPRLVHPSQLANRKIATEPGRVALIHSICHIEFNAINLALDAAYRFQNMPRDYYMDWLQVALEESRHFTMLNQRLLSLGYQYGDFDAHNGLWEMALQTQNSNIERMALVPRVLEARGLDVTPGIMQRLESAGDFETVKILEVILREEVGHVEIGTRWFRYSCAKENVDPDQTFIALLKKHNVTTGKSTLYTDARKQAGFNEVELAALNAKN